jgi:DNA-binding FrmR family transcriptional regulator
MPGKSKVSEEIMESGCCGTDSTGEDMKESCCCSSGKTKERTDKEYKDLMNRLKRIEGQVRGVEGMLENNAYCTDILTQVSAITSALNSFNKALLANHMKTCVVDNIREGNEEVIDELVVTLQKLMK